MILARMSVPVLRDMLPADVAPATELILVNEWGVRREWLAFAASNPACVPLVADAEGEIVGTGVGTANGNVGWLGTIFLAPAWRGRGFGRAITQALVDRLETAGCRTLVLVATREGRRLYERMGFEVQTRYRILEIGGLADAGAPAGPSQAVRHMAPSDLDAMAALDREATGEDRWHALERFATPATARVLEAPDSGLDAFVVRAPWGGGATAARSVDAALTIIDARRRASGPAGRVRVGLLAENSEGLERLTAAGFSMQWSAPRMVRGEPLRWHPEMLYGQFNHAMG
jgi:ribosomal protein S18 acetylase RimI-like enzyme